MSSVKKEKNARKINKINPQNQINHQPGANFPVYYPDVYLQLNMFRAFSRPSSGAQ
jgi:hypothetical protein